MCIYIHAHTHTNIHNYSVLTKGIGVGKREKCQCSIAKQTRTPPPHTHTYLYIHSVQTRSIINSPAREQVQQASSIYLQSQSTRAMTLQRNPSSARKTAPQGAQDGMGTRATGKASAGQLWDRTIRHRHRAHRVAPVPGGRPAERRGGVSSRGRRSPTCSGTTLPGRRGHCLRCGGGSPSHVPGGASGRHTEGSGGSGTAVLSRRVPGGAGCSQELKFSAERRGGAREPGGDRASRPTGGGRSRARLRLLPARDAPTRPRGQRRPAEAAGKGAAAGRRAPPPLRSHRPPRAPGTPRPLRARRPTGQGLAGSALLQGGQLQMES